MPNFYSVVLLGLFQLKGVLVFDDLAWAQFEGFFRKQLKKLTEETETYQQLERRKFCGRLINNFTQWGAL